MRTILISGANRGIGFNVSHKLLTEGNRVSIGLRDKDSIKNSVLDPRKWPSEKSLINHYQIQILILIFSNKLSSF